MVEKLCHAMCVYIYSKDVLLGNNKNKQNKLNEFYVTFRIISRDVKYIKSTLDIKEKNIFAQK